MTRGPLIHLHHAAAGYSDRYIWSGLDLTVEPGEFVGVLGPNGAGKTTLLKIVLGLRQLSAGSVTVLGSPPRRGDPRVGYIPQQRSFDPGISMRGIDLVRLGLDGHRWGLWSRGADTKTKVMRALRSVGADNYATSAIGALSGGQQQRVRVAQGLVSEPELLLADEPLLSLDPSSQSEVIASLDAHRRETGGAVVMVTHDVNPIRPHVDRILYLAAGKWSYGTPDEVLVTDTLSDLYGTPVDVINVRGRILIVGASDTSSEYAHDVDHIHEIESTTSDRGY